MIVEPDFPDHWKTRLLIDSLDGDEAAPLYVIRLWAHCQQRKTNIFQTLTPSALKALCRYPGHPNKLESCLVSSGFVRRESDGCLIVHEWDKYNASLIASWNNGKMGGRPPRQRRENPPKTHGLPTANPDGTDKRREEKIDKVDKRACATPTLDEVLAAASRASVPEDHARQFWNAVEARPLTPEGGWTTRDGQPMRMERWQHALAAYSASMARNQQGRRGGKPTPPPSKWDNEF